MLLKLISDSVAYLHENFPELKHIWSEDFLKSDIAAKFRRQF